MIVIGTSLTACQRQSSSDVPDADPFAPRTTVKSDHADQFGKAFGEAYRADPNSEPREISKNDLPPVSYTDEPVKFN